MLSCNHGPHFISGTGLLEGCVGYFLIALYRDLHILNLEKDIILIFAVKIMPGWNATATGFVSFLSLVFRPWMSRISTGGLLILPANHS